MGSPEVYRGVQEGLPGRIKKEKGNKKNHQP